MFTQAHGTGKMYTKLSRPPFLLRKICRIWLKKSLTLSSSEEHYYCEIEAERGPPETHARETHHPSSIFADAPLNSYQTYFLRDKSSPEKRCGLRQSSIVCPSVSYLKDCNWYCKEQVPPSPVQSHLLWKTATNVQVWRGKYPDLISLRCPPHTHEERTTHHAISCISHYLQSTPRIRWQIFQQSWMSLRHIASLKCLVTPSSQDYQPTDLHCSDCPFSFVQIQMM